MFAVDVPDPDNPEDSWINIACFETLNEAVEYCQTIFGADRFGRVDLISELPADDRGEKHET